MSVLLLTMGPQLGITADLPVVGVGGAGVIRFRAIGAAGPVKWTLVDSTLPAEWDSALNPDGNAVTLTTSDAETAGTFSVTVRAVDSARIPVVRSFDVRVMALPLTISGAFPNWQVGQPATGALTISGGVPPYSGLSITSGALPAGVSLSIVGSQIVASGSPSVAGPWFATVSLVDADTSQASIPLSGQVSNAILWTPEDLESVPKIWLDHSSGVTNVDGFVSSWENIGSVGGAFDQSSSSFRPQIIASGINNLRTIRFDGVDDRLVGARDTFQPIMRGVSSAAFFFVASKRTEDTSATTIPNRTLVQFNRNDNSHRIGVQLSDVSAGTYNRVSGQTRPLDGVGTIATTTADASDASWGQFNLGWFIWDGIGSKQEVRVNGRQSAISTPLSTASTTSNTIPSSRGAHIGCSSSTGAYNAFADMDLACLMVWSADLLTIDDIQRVEGYYAYIYGLQANLPEDHPYRHAPPVLDQNP